MTPTTIAGAAAALRRGEITSRDLVEVSLAAIAEHNPVTNAFIRVDADGARAQARLADKERERGVDHGPLHGIPLSVKDLIDIAGQRTTAASRVLANNIARADAPLVSRLRAAGAVIIGKTNLHEFAFGTTSEDSASGPVRHPRDRQRVAGGSSGGSAVAVATGMGLASIGSDTGGSIRIPASVCGVVGLKPSLGDVPTDGVVPLSATLDHVGPLTRTVDDARLVWQVIADRPASDLAAPAPATLRFGVLVGYFGRLEFAVRAAFAECRARLLEHGVHLEDVEIPTASTIQGAYIRIVLPEAAAWHARYLDTQGSDYSPIVRARIESGRSISAVDYLHARDERRQFRRVVDALLDQCDALVLPTLPVVAPVMGAEDVRLDDGTLPVRTAMLRQTQLFNITGHPAISIPLAVSDWPCGLQIVGRLGDTAGLLAIASTCERIVGAHAD